MPKSAAKPARLSYNIDQAIEATGLSRYQITRLIKSGELDAVRVPGRDDGRGTILIPAASLGRFLEDNAVGLGGGAA
jgi:hypothetical protein